MWLCRITDLIQDSVDLFGAPFGENVGPEACGTEAGCLAHAVRDGVFQGSNPLPTPLTLSLGALCASREKGVGPEGL